MIERLEGMPAGTIGLRAGGDLTKQDYELVLEPVLREAVESGEVRLLFVLDEFELKKEAWLEDAKTGLELGIAQRSAWKRMALVTDVEWVAKSMRLFAWMAPGKVKTYELDGLEEAQIWVAA